MTSDALIASATKSISVLADGNDISADAISVQEATRRDYAVYLSMSVDIGWKWQETISYGSTNPEGSVYVQSRGEAKRWIEERLTALANKPSTASHFAAEIGKNPREWFEQLNAGHRVGSEALLCHVHEACSACRSTGKVRCSRGGGAVYTAKRYTGFQCVTSCLSCSGKGHRPCTQCMYGRRSFQENYYDYGSKTYQTRTVTKNCSACGGTAIDPSPCYGCSGAGVVRCTICGGSGEVSCSACSGRGSKTVSSFGLLTANPKRSFKFAKEMPKVVADAAIDIGSIKLLSEAVVGSASVTSTSGQVKVDFPVTLPHVHLKLAFGNVVRHAFDFIGTKNRAWKQPAFLDDLLNIRITNIQENVRSGNALRAIKLAQETPATRGILGVTLGKSGHSGEVVSRWKGALSLAVVSSAEASLRTAYNSIGLVAARRCWQVAILPLVLWGCATPLLWIVPTVILLLVGPKGLNPYPDEALLIAATCVIGILPLPLFCLAAGQIARRRVRQLTGEASARRRPAQGRWATTGIVATLLAFGAGLAGHYHSEMLPDPIRTLVASAIPDEAERPEPHFYSQAHTPVRHSPPLRHTRR